MILAVAEQALDVAERAGGVVLDNAERAAGFTDRALIILGVEILIGALIVIAAVAAWLLVRYVRQLVRKGEEDRAGYEKTLKEMAESSQELSGRMLVIVERNTSVHRLIARVLRSLDQTGLLNLGPFVEEFDRLTLPEK